MPLSTIEYHVHDRIETEFSKHITRVVAIPCPFVCVLHSMQPQPIPISTARHSKSNPIASSAEIIVEFVIEKLRTMMIAFDGNVATVASAAVSLLRAQVDHPRDGQSQSKDKKQKTNHVNVMLRKQ